MSPTVTIYRVELDFRDDEMAQVHWYPTRAGARQLVKDIEADNPDMNAEDAPEKDPGSYDGGRPAVIATMQEIEVPLTLDGIVGMLRHWCTEAAPE